jgi:phosphatidylserine/phosphatidylglycerophosphate/cardiolipin synthase-like enzyme
MVIDSATIITGSCNFTKKAEESNAENLLMIKDAPELVKTYEANVQAHAAHSHPYMTYEANVQAHAAHSHPYMRQAPTVPLPGARASENDGEVRGNKNSKVYRVPECQKYAGMKNPAAVIAFATEGEAQQAGYRKAKDCP